MAIVGVGTDIVKKTRIKRLLERFGKRFVAKVLTEFEQTLYAKLRSEAAKAAYLAKRFAAKEAVAKALGTGISGVVVLPEIEIYNDANGKPEIRFLGKTKKFAASLKIKTVHISISDETEMAVSFVILER
jgi:holo-[acyl-carrier protein] synthase